MFPRLLRAIGSLLIVLALSVDAGAFQVTDIRHPRPEFLVRPEGVPVRPLRASGDSDFVATLAERFKKARRVALIGAADGPPEQVFGEIAAAVIGPQDRIYVLDSQFSEVRIFTPAGSFIGAFGRPGPGPGEFTIPASLTIRNDSLALYVGDRIRKIHAFSIATEASYDRSIVTRTDAETLCSFSDAIVAGGESVGIPNAIHQYAPDGEVLRAFASVYPSPHGAVNASLSGILVACDVEDAFMLLAARDLGEVRRYSRTGELEWIAADETFDHAEIVERGVMVYVTVPEDGFERIDSLTVLSEDLALVQIVRHLRTDAPPGLPQISSQLLATDNGDSHSLGTELPLILGVTDSYYVTLEGLLDPQLGIYVFAQQ